ncbi:lipoprotein [Spiroplasma chrysopicola]|uniref:Lipoprotein n=1 Tax=Spiroplasma chrysopicola DF-1 TaxID=1276227 RepID=R4UAJ5_9MOLU|nr:lipoprotein [Spiroplasma chrysopicola]AGM24934.1 hypothetical protein SCHRY_v1c03510 [Spiroplasma chrysopicola DF-1]
MKKLLTILSVLTITTTGASSVVACSGKGHVTDNKKEVSQKIKEVLKKYTKDKPFKLSREEGNKKDRLIKELKATLSLGSNSNIEVLDQDYQESNLKEINDQNEKVKVEPGVAMIIIKINNKEVYKDKIFWTTLQNGIVQEGLEQFKTMQGELGGMVVKQTGKVTKKISDIDENDIENSFKARFNKTLNFKVNKITYRPSLRSLKNRTLDDKTINYGTINLECWINTEKSKTIIYDGTINWVSESITDIVNANDILNKKGTSSNITNVDLPFSLPVFGTMTFGGITEKILPALRLLGGVKEKVAKVYESIGNPTFEKNWKEFLDWIILLLSKKDESAKEILNKNVNDCLPDDAKKLIDISGTVGDLLTNMAPSLVSLLHWVLNHDFETNNFILELLQYLLSSVDQNVQIGIKKTWGEDSLLYKNTKTNLDSLIYELLVGYKEGSSVKIMILEPHISFFPGVIPKEPTKYNFSNPDYLFSDNDRYNEILETIKKLESEKKTLSKTISDKTEEYVNNDSNYIEIKTKISEFDQELKNLKENDPKYKNVRNEIRKLKLELFKRKAQLGSIFSETSEVLEIQSKISIIEDNISKKEDLLPSFIGFNVTKIMTSILNKLSNFNPDGENIFEIIDRNVLANISLSSTLTLASEFVISPLLWNKIGNDIFSSLGVKPSKEIKVRLTSGNAKIMLKNKNGVWEDLKDMFNGKANPDLSQFMTAKDFKIHLSNLQFELNSTVDEDISLTTSDNLSFDIVFSDQKN